MNDYTHFKRDFPCSKVKSKKPFSARKSLVFLAIVMLTPHADWNLSRGFINIFLPSCMQLPPVSLFLYWQKHHCHFFFVCLLLLLLPANVTVIACGSRDDDVKCLHFMGFPSFSFFLFFPLVSDWCWCITIWSLNGLAFSIAVYLFVYSRQCCYCRWCKRNFYTPYAN